MRHREREEEVVEACSTRHTHAHNSDPADTQTLTQIFLAVSTHVKVKLPACALWHYINDSVATDRPWHNAENGYVECATHPDEGGAVSPRNACF